MTLLDKQMTVGEMVVQRPSRSILFEQMGIDYCCGGKLPLETICHKKGLNVEDVLVRLAEFDRQQADKLEKDWSAVTISELVENILNVHHVYTRESLERLTRLVTKVADVHGLSHPELIQIRQLFLGLAMELDMHMEKEERVLFPYSLEIEANPVQDHQFHCGSIRNPIRVMLREHEDAGSVLEKIRELTNQYTLPEGACNSYRALYDGMQALEYDLHVHIHKENNILFPKVLTMAGLSPEEGGGTCASESPYPSIA